MSFLVLNFKVLSFLDRLVVPGTTKVVGSCIVMLGEISMSPDNFTTHSHLILELLFLLLVTNHVYQLLMLIILEIHLTLSIIRAHGLNINFSWI